jgi:tetrapyrrole methylase family protein/MazG family protein
MPKGITIVGLGPGAPGLLTVEARQVLQSAQEIFLRTRRHPTAEALPPSAAIHSFDYVYEQAEDFAQVYAEIASRVVELGEREQGVIYAVPGHPMVGEASVQGVLDLAAQRNVPVRLVEGLSFVEPVCSMLHIDPLNGLQSADAMTLAGHHYSEFSPDLPLIVGQLYSRQLAADVKLVLMMVYPEDHPITLIQAAGTDHGKSARMALYELDRGADFDHLTSLYVPALSQPGSLAAFQELVAHLRAPEGCPWDREQTHGSLRPYLLEETYEVLQALDAEDAGMLREELGDLLLQILLHTQIAVEEQEFTMADVVSYVVAKLERRHPHVFGRAQVSGAQEVLVNWERIKKEEKDHQQREGVVSDVPAFLPALSRAQVLQRRAARIGFERPDVAALRMEIEKQWKELRDTSDEETTEGHLGNLLFSLADLAGQLGVDAESALRRAVLLFERHCATAEQEATTQGGQLIERRGH